MDMYKYLKARRLDVSLYPSITVDSTIKTVTFPLWSLTGRFVGMQAHKPLAGGFQREKPSEARYFTLLPDPASRLTAFGVDLLDSTQKVLFLAEGVFDVSPLHCRGINALAVLSNNPKHLKSWLHSLGYFLVALVEDDAAGKKLANIAHEAIYLEDGKDPGDMPDVWFDSLVNNYRGKRV